MKRFVQLLIVFVLMTGTLGMGLAAQAQEAPEGTFYGAWPYPLPADHHLNPYATSGPGDIGGIIFYPMVKLPLAFYQWADNSYSPGLAEEWGFDGEEAYVVKLREDATWSDGTPVTAQDVVTTYALGRLFNWGDFNYVDEVIAEDDYTVRFTLHTPALVIERFILKSSLQDTQTFGEFAERAMELHEQGLTDEDEEWLDLQTEVKEFRPEELIASGPYNYTLDDVGEAFMTLSWQPNSIFSDTVKFGTIHIWYGETDAVTPLIMDGEIAYATHGFPPATSQAFAEAGIRIIRNPYYYGPAIQFNHSVYPWNVKEVRQAIAHVVDRAENAFLTKGLSAAPVQNMVNLSDNLVPLWLEEATIEQLNPYEYDLEKAEALMESAGFYRDDDDMWMTPEGDPVQGEFSFHAEWADFAACAQHATDSMNAFGFDITARAVQWQQMQQDRLDGNFEITVHSWGSGSPFPTDAFRNPVVRFSYELSGDETGLNFPVEFDWNGETVNFEDMVAATGAGLDTEAQKEVIQDVALIFNDMLPVIPMSQLLGNAPFNEDLVQGPSEDHPIWINSIGDNFVPILLLNGELEPGPEAMN